MKKSSHSLVFIAIYFSLFSQMQAISLLGIVIPLSLVDKQASHTVIGLVMACYSLGLILGCLKGKNFIQFVGHIRAFSGFAALAAIVSILHYLIDHIILSAIYRFVTGLSAAVLLIVLESWCLEISKQRNSTNVIAGYQFTFYAAMASGLILINFFADSINSTYLIAALLFSVALIPMALIKIDNPQLKMESISIKRISKLSPIGVIGAIAAGSAIGSVYNMAPVFARGLGISTLEISFFMIAIVLSGVLLQHGINKLSNHIERPQLLMTVLIVLSVNALLLTKFKYDLPLPLLGAMLGCLISCIYPLSLNLTAKVTKASSVSISSTLLLFYGVGGFLGPIIAGKAMANYGNDALFYYLSLSLIFAVALIALFNKRSEIKAI